MAGRAGIVRFGDGQSTLDVRLGQTGVSYKSYLHAEYYESAVRGSVFFSTNLAKKTTIGSATTTVQIGNIVWNPPDSGVNLDMKRWVSHIIVATTATGVAVGLGYQSTPPTTLIQSDAWGGTMGVIPGPLLNTATPPQALFPIGKAKAYSSAELLFAPVAMWYLHSNTTGLAVTGVDNTSGSFTGGLIVPPGGIVAMQMIGAAAGNAGHSSSLSWEEVKVL